MKRKLIDGYMIRYGRIEDIVNAFNRSINNLFNDYWKTKFILEISYDLHFKIFIDIEDEDDLRVICEFLDYYNLYYNELSNE